MKPYGIIYLITNKINGKQYVGQTIETINSRWSKHKYKGSKSAAMSNAIKKYGSENFTIEQIATANSSQELNKKEHELIINLGTLSPKGYNLTDAGDSPILSEETRLKKSVSIKKKYQDPEHAAKMDKVFHEPERIAKIGAASKDRWEDPEYKKNTIASMQKVMSTPKYKENQSKGLKEANKRPEVKQKRSNGSKKMWEDLEYRTNHANAMAEINKDPQYIRKLELKSEKYFKFTLEGNLVKVYECIADVVRDGFVASSIISVANGNRKTHKGFIWRREPDVVDNKPKDIEYKRKSEAYPDRILGTISSRPVPLKRTKGVLQFDLDGNFIKKYESTTAPVKDGFIQSSVSQCCRGKIKLHKGYIWRFE